MSIVIHTGQKPPTLTEYFDPDAIREIWFKWPDDLTIVTSEFILPDGVVEVSKKQAQNVIVDGTTYENCNAILLDFNQTTDKKIFITNRVTFTNGESDDKSCYAIIKQT